MSTEPTLRLDNAAEISTSLQLLSEHQTYHQRTVQCVARSIYGDIFEINSAPLYPFTREKEKILRDIRLDRNVLNVERKKEGEARRRNEKRGGAMEETLFAYE